MFNDEPEFEMPAATGYFVKFVDITTTITQVRTFFNSCP